MNTHTNIHTDDLSVAESNVINRTARKLVHKLFAKLQHGELTVIDSEGTTIFGDTETPGRIRAAIHFHDPSAYREIVFSGTLGAAEAYVRGEWTTPSLVDAIRVFVQNMSLVSSIDSGLSRILTSFLRLAYRLFERNTKEGSRKNIAAHYDLGNDMFQLFLDKTMMYSSAIYPSESATLEEAQAFRLNRICKKLDLRPEDHLVEIGTGWGGMAIHAAKHFGCRVTTTTISKEQYDFAKKRIVEEGLEDRITLLLEDYRNLTGKFDKLVSIEMIEAVGYQFYDTFFETCSNLLKNDGIMLLQAILIEDQRYERAKTDVDFIKRYIFPGSCIPSFQALHNAMVKSSDMMLTHVEDITSHYARTLADWREGFMGESSKLKELGYDDRFIRLWEFYFAYCEAGFSERVIRNNHILLAKPGNRRAHVLGQL